MQQRFSHFYDQKWIQICFLLVFCVVLYFLNLGQWDLWSPDEPRYAEVAREMVAGGDWILMHYNGNVYPDKPPLFFWLVGLSSFLWQGFTSFSARFPAAFFGMLTVVLAYFLGRSLFGSGVGLISGLILATSFEFGFRSTRANIDSTLTFFMTASLLCFIDWYRSRQERGDHGANSKLLVGFYVGMAFATLAKGPVGFILPFLVSLIYLILQRDWTRLKEMKLPVGMLLMVTLVLAWYVPAVLKGGEAYLHETLFIHSLARFSHGLAKVRPIYYYLYNFPISFLPWAIFLPAACAYGGLKKMKEKRQEYLFLFVWFGVIFLFFSLSKGKRPLYLLPLFPAAATLVGKLWYDLIFASMDDVKRRWISIPLYGLIGVGVVGCGAVPWVVSVKAPSLIWYSLPVAFLLMGVSLAMFFMYRWRHYGMVLTLIIGMAAAGFFYTQRVFFPALNPYKSVRQLSQEITSRISSGDKLCVYGRVSASAYNFYTGIVPIFDFSRPEDLIRFLKSPERVFCLLPFEDFSQFQTNQDNRLMRLIARHQVGDTDVVLVSNR